MGKLIKTEAKDLINLQSGMYAHFVEDGIAVNDVKTYEPRHRVSRINESKNYRPVRIVLNILFSVVIISAAYFSGFYPLSLLLFLSLYDLRSIQSNTIPENLSNFIPYSNIEEVKLVRGRLGFNYALIIIKDDEGKKSFKKLKLYDSSSTWDRSKVLFERIGKLNFKEEEAKDITGIDRITIGNGIEYGIEDDSLLLIENGKFNSKREDPFKYFRFIAIIGFLFCVMAIVLKLIDMVSLHNYAIADFTVLIIFLLMSSVPFRLISRSHPTVIKKNEILHLKEKKKNYILTLKGWNVFSRYIKLSKKYFTPEELGAFNKFIKS